MTLRSRPRSEALAQIPVRVQAFGRAGAAATAVSIVLTLIVALLGPSVMEPALPGRPGQPPWSLVAHPSGYLVLALTAAAILVGAIGLGATMRAARRGWSVSPGLILAAGLLAAVLLALMPPFGSSDHLSYAAYGRMLTTGHNPYLTGPNVLARLGDPVARAVEDWKTSPSVYGVLATGGQAVASLIGGTSVRLTVFVLSLLNLAGFAGTGLLLHRLAAGDRGRQLRAALLWTCNPLLLQVLVAGEHVDSQAIVFGVGAIAALALALRRSAAGDSAWRCLLPAAAAGALAGLGFAVKIALVLVVVGMAAACLLANSARTGPPLVGLGRTSTLLVSLTGGFALVAAAAVAIGGLASVRSPLSAGSYVAIGTPWRWVRAAISLATGEGAADDIVKAAAAVTVLALAWLMLRRLPGPASLSVHDRCTETGVIAPGNRHRSRTASQETEPQSIAAPRTSPNQPKLADPGNPTAPTSNRSPTSPASLTGAAGLAAQGVSSSPTDPASLTSAAVSGNPTGPTSPASPTGTAGLVARGASGDPVGPASLTGAAGVVARGVSGSLTDPASSAGAVGVVARGALAFALAWLTAGPYVLPWYDALAWGLLPLLPWSAIDWLVLARTTSLAIGYLPARTVAMPAGTGWLVTVVRRGVTPALLLAVAVLLVITLRSRNGTNRPVPAEG
jgi:hypothetical protein